MTSIVVPGWPRSIRQCSTLWGPTAGRLAVCTGKTQGRECRFLPNATAKCLATVPGLTSLIVHLHFKRLFKPCGER